MVVECARAVVWRMGEGSLDMQGDVAGTGAAEVDPVCLPGAAAGGASLGPSFRRCKLRRGRWHRPPPLVARRTAALRTRVRRGFADIFESARAERAQSGGAFS